MNSFRRGWGLASLLLLAFTGFGCASLNPFHPIAATWNIAMAGQDLDTGTEIALGDGIARQFVARCGLYPDERAHQYVTLVGNALVLATERRDLPWKFAIIDTATINAFACPGGTVLITRGTWENVRSEAELAGILGHEIGHIVRRDAILEYRKANVMAAATEEFVGDNVIPFDKMISWITENLLFKGFARKDELAADRFGVRCAAALGYYPGGLADFMDRCLKMQTTAPVATGSLFSNYPDTEERVRKLRTLTRTAPYRRLRGAPQLGERLQEWRTPVPAPAPAVSPVPPPVSETAAVAAPE